MKTFFDIDKQAQKAFMTPREHGSKLNPFERIVFPIILLVLAGVCGFGAYVNLIAPFVS